MSIRVGTAGWNIRGEYRDCFPVTGSQLERYSHRLNAVEINSSFYRPHRLKTYERWAAAVPDDFRFAVKTPKAITHTKMLEDVSVELEQFLGSIVGLGKKLEVLLVQLPPRLRFQESVVKEFFRLVRSAYSGGVVCEPRHLSWFEPRVERVLFDCNVSRVAADPSIGSDAFTPGGSSEVIYFRWHGSPDIYYSMYSTEQLIELSLAARAKSESSRCVWCVFDNTARGAATSNSLALASTLGVDRANFGHSDSRGIV